MQHHTLGSGTAEGKKCTSTQWVSKDHRGAWKTAHSAKAGGKSSPWKGERGERKGGKRGGKAPAPILPGKPFRIPGVTHVQRMRFTTWNGRVQARPSPCHFFPIFSFSLFSFFFLFFSYTFLLFCFWSFPSYLSFFILFSFFFLCNLLFLPSSFSGFVWGPVVQWLVQRFRSERLRVRSRRSATFTPSAHVRRQSLPVWPPTLNKIYLYLTFFFGQYLFFSFLEVFSLSFSHFVPFLLSCFLFPCFYHFVFLCLSLCFFIFCVFFALFHLIFFFIIFLSLFFLLLFSFCLPPPLSLLH